MDDIDNFLNIVKVKQDYLSPVEKNALLLYSLSPSALLSLNRKYYEHIKLERLIDTLAFIMELKVQEYQDENNIEFIDFENDIRYMGWTDEYIEETFKIWSRFEDNQSAWGHRMVSDWARIWLSSNLEEYIMKHNNCKIESKGDIV